MIAAPWPSFGEAVQHLIRWRVAGKGVAEHIAYRDFLVTIIIEPHFGIELMHPPLGAGGSIACIAIASG